MKTKLFLIWLMVVCCLPAHAQTSGDDYFPFVQDGKTWEIQIGIIRENLYGNRVDGDTVIGDETWKKVYNYVQLPQLNYSYYAAVRDVGKKVYAIAKGSNRPRLLYDFGMKVGDMVRCGVEGNAFFCLLEKGEQPDTLLGFKYDAYLRLERIDTVETYGLRLRRFTLSMLDVFKEQIANDIVWVEGVGSCFSPFTPWMPLLSRDRYFFFKWCKIGNSYISDEDDFYDNNETNGVNKKHLGKDENGLLYNLQGLRVRQPFRGVYIQGREKHIAK